jgi:hypothetical protein
VGGAPEPKPIKISMTQNKFILLQQAAWYAGRSRRSAARHRSASPTGGLIRDLPHVPQDLVHFFHRKQAAGLQAAWHQSRQRDRPRLVMRARGLSPRTVLDSFACQDSAHAQTFRKLPEGEENGGSYHHPDDHQQHQH